MIPFPVMSARGAMPPGGYPLPPAYVALGAAGATELLPEVPAPSQAKLVQEVSHEYRALADRSTQRAFFDLETLVVLMAAGLISASIVPHLVFTRNWRALTVLAVPVAALVFCAVAGLLALRIRRFEAMRVSDLLEQLASELQAE